MHIEQQCEMLITELEKRGWVNQASTIYFPPKSFYARVLHYQNQRIEVRHHICTAWNCHNNSRDHMFEILEELRQVIGVLDAEAVLDSREHGLIPRLLISMGA